MKNKTLLSVVIALILAVIAGALTGPDTQLWGVSILQIYSLIGQLFLNALTLVVVPLVVASIITGTARMGQQSSFGKLGVKTFGSYVLTTMLAVATGWAFSMLIQPGTLMGPQASLDVEADVQKLSAVHAIAEGGAFNTLGLILLKLIPSNILAIASQGQMLGLIFFCVLFGLFIPKIEPRISESMQMFWEGIFQVMMKMTHLVMKGLPIGVFGLVAKVVATTGFASIYPIMSFFMTVLAALFIYMFVILPILLKFVAGVSPIKHYRAMTPAIFTAFFTSSTAATLPVTIECVEKNARVSNTICSFTIPLASSLNLSGSACYTAIAVFFICQAYGVEVTFSLQLFISLLAVMTSMSMGGIPSASLAAIILILQSVGLPAEGVVLIMAVERILDMFRTSVNVFGNTCCAVLVAKLEGEKDVLA